CLFLMFSEFVLATPKVLFLGAAPVQEGKLEMLQPLALQQGLQFDFKMLENNSALTPDDLKGYDFLAIDAAYGPAVAMLQTQLLPSIKNTNFPWFWLRRDGNQSHKLPAELVEKLATYYSNGGKQNYSGYFCTLKAYLDNKPAQCVEPKIYPEAAIYSPNAHGEVFTSLRDFLIFKKSGQIVASNQTAPSAQPQAPSLIAPNQSIIGILFHKSYMDSGLTQSLDNLINKLEEKGALVVPMYASAMNPGEITSLVTYQGKPQLDVLINMQIMLNSAGRKTELEALGASVLQMINYHKGDMAAWEQDNIGLTPMDIPFYLSEPEYAGLIDPIIASASNKNDSQQPIERQVSAVVNKAMSLAALKHKPHNQVKSAILFYNYPPGEKNLGASFMNVPQSLETLLKSYQARGYDVQTRSEQQLIDELTSLLTPYYRPEQLPELIKAGKAGKLPFKTYMQWFSALPKPVQERVNARWGTPENASLKVANEDYFAIPALRLGKQIIMPQPPRGEREADKEKQLYHDTKTPPSHSYLAAYLWLKQAAKVDAVVHFGTHGTQEWQPGKERGLDMLDDPMLTIGDIPVIYPYIVDNIGEALQTKRRGRAVTISHHTPAFGPAGLHTELTALHELLHQWLNITEGEVKAQTQQSVISKAQELNLDKDLNLDLASHDFADSVNQLHMHL
ncbi:MAG: cobaltochelatase subunit CobN, partial [Venatoribacter sp.]